MRNEAASPEPRDELPHVITTLAGIYSSDVATTHVTDGVRISVFRAADHATSDGRHATEFKSDLP